MRRFATGWIQVSVYTLPIVFLVMWVAATRNRPLQAEADVYAAFAAFIVRAAFWTMALVGLVDAVLSFLRVEEFLSAFVVGDELTVQLGRSVFRGQYVHLPLMVLSCVIALFTRSLSFIWLALLIVLAEFQIVITRFIFSYEQAFMGDLVRFWYGSLFLLASAYSLIDEGHVRVDVFYARFSERGKARTNAVGSMLLGVPLCWIILTMGMWTKGSSLANPMLNFEISQSGVRNVREVPDGGTPRHLRPVDGGAVLRLLPRERGRAAADRNRRAPGAGKALVERPPWSSSFSSFSS